MASPTRLPNEDLFRRLIAAGTLVEIQTESTNYGCTLLVRGTWVVDREDVNMPPRNATRSVQKEGRLDLLNRIKNLNLDREGELDELVALGAFARKLREEYDANAIPVPAWLSDNTVALRKEIAARRRDAIERELKLIDAEEDALKTKEERRSDLRARKERLQAALATP